MEIKKLIIYVLLFAAMIVCAVAGYNYLSDKYAPNAPLPDKESQNEQKIPAPDFEVLDTDGEAVKLSEKLGKPIILNFWATWCGPCKAELPHFEKAYREYGDIIEFMMVNQTDGTDDTVESVNEFVSKGGYTFPVYFDTRFNASLTYGISSIPVTFFIDKDGNILYGYRGTMSENTLYAYIDMIYPN